MSEIHGLPEEQLTGEEAAVRSRQALGFLVPMLARHKRGLGVCLLLLLIGTGLSLVWPILLKDSFDTHLATRDYGGLVVNALIILVILIGMLILQFVQRLKLETIGQAVMVSLKQQLFEHILKLDLPFFDRNPVGRLMARVESDTEAIRQLFTITAVILAGDLLLTIGTIGVMLWYNWPLTLIILTVIPVTIVMVVIFERITTPKFLEVRKKTAELVALLTEFLHGLPILQIFNRQRWAHGRLLDANRNRYRPDVYSQVGVVIFVNLVTFMQYVMMGLLLYFGIRAAQSGEVTVGLISMFIILIWRLFEPLYRTSEELSNVQRAIAGAKRLYALLHTEPKLVNPPAPRPWLRLQQGIRFENVWFSYTGDQNWTLKDVTFDIPVGSRVALAGVTGGGKSTVISLLLRYYDPQRGRVLVDGVDIREIAQEDLRKRFALVLQDIILFPGDIRYNIALSAEELSDGAIRGAAQTVGAHRFIERLPAQYQTEVSEKGANFSRGERQLLSFARALAVNPDVLVLDEATSSVDPETERTIQGSLKALMAGRTSLIIAHRLSTILDVDQILVMRQGEIVERGTHTELLLANGYYTKLFHLQYKHLAGEVSHA